MLLKPSRILVSERVEVLCVAMSRAVKRGSHRDLSRIRGLKRALARSFRYLAS